MADIIDIIVRVTDLASRKMDDIANNIDRSTRKIESRTGSLGGGFSKARGEIDLTAQGADKLVLRLDNLEKSLQREENAITRLANGTAKAGDKNRSYELSFKNLAVEMRRAAAELEKGGFVNQAEEMKDRADDLDHSIKTIGKDVENMSVGFQKNRQIAKDTANDLSLFKSATNETRTAVRDAAVDLRKFEQEGARVESGLQRMINSVERWRQAKLRDNQSTNAFTKAFSNFNTTIDRTERRFLILLTLVPTLATVIFGLAGAVTSLVGGLGAAASALSTLSAAAVLVPGAIAAIGGAFASLATIIKPAVSGIVTGVQALKQLPGRQAARNNRSDPTGQQDQVQQAEEQLSRAREDGVQRVSDAERQLFRTRRDNVRQEKNAEVELARFRRDSAETEADAVRSLSELRVKSKQREVDLQTKLNDLIRQNRETEDQLQQNLALAKAGLANANQPGGGGDLILAKGAVKDATAQLQQFNQDKKTQEDAARRDLKQTQAQDRKDVADAERNLARLRRDDAERTKELEQNLADLRVKNAEQASDAERNLARAREDSARSIKDAQDQLNKSVAQGKDGILQTNQAWLNLSPTQQRIAKEINGIRLAFDKLTAPARARVFGVIEEGLNRLETHLPGVARQISGFTDAIVDTVRKGMRSFDDPTFSGAFERVATQAQTSVRRIGGALVDLFQTIVRFTDAGRPFIDFVTRAISHFGEWALATEKQSQASGRLATFFDHAKEVATILGHTLRDLFVTLKNIGAIGFPFGETVLRDWENLAAQARKFTESVSGQNRVKEFFQNTIPVFLELERTLGAIVKAIFQIGNAANAGGANSGMAKFLRTLQDSFLPFLVKFINTTATQFGPVLGQFFAELGKTLATLGGDQGPLKTLIQAFTEMLKIFNALPGPIKTATVYFLFFGRLFGVTGALSKIWGELVKKAIERAFLQGGIPILKLFAQRLADLDLALRISASKMADRFNAIRTAVTSNLSKAAEAIKNFGRASDAEGDVGFIGRLKKGFSDLGRNISTFAKTSVAQVRAAAARIALAMREAAVATAQFARALAVTAVRALVTFTRASIAAIAENPILLLLAAIVIAIVLVITHFNTFKRVVTDVFDFLRRIGQDVIDFFQHHWKDILLVAITGPFGAAILAIQKLGPQFLQLGKDIMNGIKNGIIDAADGIGKAMKDGVKKGIDFVKHGFGIFSPSLVTRDEIGKPLGQGIVEGASQGIAPLGDELRKQIDAAMQKAKTAVDNAKTQLQGAFSNLSDALNAQFDARLNVQTPAEKALAALDAQDQAKQRAKDRRDAANAVSSAKGRLASLQAQLQAQQHLLETPTGTAGISGFKVLTPDQRREAQSKSRDLQQQIRQANSDLRTAQAARKDTEDRIAEEDKRAALQRQAEKERASLEQAVEKQRESANKQIAALVDTINNANNTTKVQKARDKLISILADNGIFVTNGKVVGNGLISGMEDSVNTALSRLDTLRKKMIAHLKVDKTAQQAIIESYLPFQVTKDGKLVSNSPFFQSRAMGGEITGPAPGRAVNAIVHVGEWVLNPQQQQRLAAVFGGLQRARSYVFGSSFATQTTGSFASGGVVGATSTISRTIERAINQDFWLIQNHELDVDYLMEVAARAANRSFG